MLRQLIRRTGRILSMQGSGGRVPRGSFMSTYSALQNKNDIPAVKTASNDVDILNQFLEESLEEDGDKDSELLNNFLEDKSEYDLKDYFAGFNLENSKSAESKESQFLDTLSNLTNTSVDNSTRPSDILSGASPLQDDANREEGVVFDEKFISEERQTFMDIFNTYMEKSSDDDADLLANLDGTKLNDNKIVDLILQYTRGEKSAEQAEELFRKTKESLEPTIDYISNIGTEQLLEYFDQIVINWKELSVSSPETVFLRELLSRPNGDLNTTQLTIDLMNRIKDKSIIDATKPELNVFTLPIIFNTVIKTFALKYQEPQVALSLYNSMKSDVNFFTMCCNQQTYNEVIKIIWIFQGKSSLFGLEKIVLEMINNGFTGDLTTFNILKQALVDYYNIKMGVRNGERGHRSMWTQEDDKRAQNIEKKLREMGKKLNKFV